MSQTLKRTAEAFLFTMFSWTYLLIVWNRREQNELYLDVISLEFWWEFFSFFFWSCFVAGIFNRPFIHSNNLFTNYLSITPFPARISELNRNSIWIQSYCRCFNIENEISSKSQFGSVCVCMCVPTMFIYGRNVEFDQHC